MLKIVRRPNTPNWVMRGTVRGQSVEESTGTPDKKIAEQIRVKRESELMNESLYGKSATATFAHATLDYLEQGGDKRFLQPLLDHFKTTLLRNIGQHEIDLAAKKLYPAGGPATRNRQVYSPISAILHHAARKGWCNVPTLVRPKQSKGVIRWLKPDEADRLIDACAPHLQPLVIFLIYTGARAGEALWLDWSNVDLVKRQVTFPKTKNGSPRSVPLHPRVMQSIASLPHRDGYVFRTPTGTPYRAPTPDDTSAGSRIGTAFQGACKRAGITDFRVHDLRHTWATWFYRENHDLTALQKLGGWKTPSMVFRYSHSDVSEHANSIGALPWGKQGEAIVENGTK